MSAPLVVNTNDGTCWTRRSVTRGGLALYAPAGVCGCPEFVMATLAELAEHGIAGSADVLPMPVGPEPLRPTPVQGMVLAELIGDVKPASPKLLRAFGEAVRDCREHEHPTGEDFYCLNLATWMGERAALVLRSLLDAEAENARLRARVAELEAEKKRAAEHTERLSSCLVARTEELLAAESRVSELETERHDTNEALDDAVTELRTPYAERARRETHPGRRQAWRLLAQVEESERVANALLTPEAARSADKLTALLAPTQALREVPDGEHAARVHHDYRVGRDLPETGGAR